MKNDFINVPLYTTIEEITAKDFTLSATQFKTLNIKNSNCKKLSEFLTSELDRKMLGTEVGSEAYVDKSNYYFIKTKALQPESYILDEGKDSIICISPKSFNKMKLEKGDIIISKDSNVGEVVILDRDLPNYMLCGAIYKLPIDNYKYYVLAFLKNDIVRQQIDFLVPRGSTIRHGKTKFLDCQIPLPNRNVTNTIEYIETLMKCIVNKEIKIKENHYLVLSKIEKELKNNQKKKSYAYNVPTINEIMELDRMDSSLYSDSFKQEEFLINNYINGTSSIYDLGFDISRGQNLQISNIGKSIYSDEYNKDFYTLILPKDLTKYGTVSTKEYLGNSNKLKTLKKGDIIFGAEGNEKGRSLVILEDKEKAITNIHGITLNQKDHNIDKGIFIKLFLDYYRSKGMIDSYAVGGNGGSLAIKYWNYLRFPNFSTEVESDIIRYYNNQQEYNISGMNFSDLYAYDNEYNNKVGIFQLEQTKEILQEKLNDAINSIINDIQVDCKL